MIVNVPVATASQVQPGWFVYFDGAEALPAWDFPFITDIATTRIAFSRAFLGVAVTGKAAGVTGSIEVQTSGTFTRPGVVGISEIGEEIGPAENAGTLDNTTIEQVPRAEAIGRVVKGTPFSEPENIGIQIASAFFAPTTNINAGVGSLDV